MASYLAMTGVSLAEIAEVLGHQTLSMVKRYAHLSEAHISGVVARMNAAIFRFQVAQTGPGCRGILLMSTAIQGA